MVSVRTLRLNSSSWCSAECSESTGTTLAPESRMIRATTGPPATSDSLLARARSSRRRTVSSVQVRPAEPTAALSTTSGWAASSSAAGSACTVTPSGTPAADSPSRAAPSRTATSRQPVSPAASTSAPVSRRTARPTTSRMSERATTSRACRPIDPLAPTMTTLRLSTQAL